MTSLLTWTKDTPTKPGWYWYRYPDMNMGKPMPAWVFDSHKVFYVNFLAVHEEPVVERLTDTRGEWAGPVEPPT